MTIEHIDRKTGMNKSRCVGDQPSQCVYGPEYFQVFDLDDKTGRH